MPPARPGKPPARLTKVSNKTVGRHTVKTLTSWLESKELSVEGSKTALVHRVVQKRTCIPDHLLPLPSPMDLLQVSVENVKADVKALQADLAIKDEEMKELKAANERLQQQVTALKSQEADGAAGHRAVASSSEANKTVDEEATDPMGVAKCGFCGRTGHVSRMCREHIRKPMAAYDNNLGIAPAC